MYDGIDGWMCPWESRCVAILGADKCQKRGAAAASASRTSTWQVTEQSWVLLLPASAMGAPPTGRNVSPFHPNWEANISVSLFARLSNSSCKQIVLATAFTQARNN